MILACGVQILIVKGFRQNEMLLVRVKIVLALRTKYAGGLAVSPAPRRHDALHGVLVVLVVLVVPY